MATKNNKNIKEEKQMIFQLKRDKASIKFLA
jgi:hypothetical protein